MTTARSSGPSRRFLAAGLGAVVLAGTLAAAGPAAAAPPPAPLFGGSGADGYVVVLKDGATAGPAAARAQDWGGVVRQQFTALIQGFAAQLSAAELDRVRRDPSVAFVQAEQTYTTQATQNIGRDGNWGLNRIDQRRLTRSNTYRYSTTGKGVTAFVIDTGITQDQPDLQGRLEAGAGFVDDGNGSNDCDGVAQPFFGVNFQNGEGHGTHVAGIIGGTKYGVAKDVRLVPVRVLGCQGQATTSTVIAGLNWVRTHRPNGPAVANLSLGGGGKDEALDAAVRRLIGSGVTVVVAAGNGDPVSGKGQDACGLSPAGVREALVVGATGKKDARAGFSNFGPCVDVNAPGVNITSDYVAIDENFSRRTGTATFSGTSMAAPFVTGAVARYLQTHPRATPAQVQSASRAGATKNIVTGGTTPRSLLYLAP